MLDHNVGSSNHNDRLKREPNYNTPCHDLTRVSTKCNSFDALFNEFMSL